MKRRAALVGLAAPLVARRAGAQPAPYKIGLTIPLTGPFANTVAEYLPAYQLGVADLNRSGGIGGRPVQLHVEDSQASPQAGIAAMRKLVDVDGVEVMMTLFTTVVTAQIPLADQLRMPTVAVVEAPHVVDKATFTFAHGTRVEKVDPLLSRYWRRHGFKRMYAFLANNAIGQALRGSVTENAHAAEMELQISTVVMAEARHFTQALDFLSSRREAFPFEKMLSNTFSLERTGDALREMAALREIKPVIYPNAHN